MDDKEEMGDKSWSGMQGESGGGYRGEARSNSSDPNVPNEHNRSGIAQAFADSA